MSTPTIKTAAGHALRPTGEVCSSYRGLFTVTAGIPLLDALQSVSALLSTISEPINDAAMGIKALEHNPAWLVDHSLASAQAVIYSLIDSLEYPDRLADQHATE
jgi:hypothetical protein